MIDAGMNVAKINFTSKNFQDHLLTLQCLNEAIAQNPTSRHCSVLLDLKGQVIDVDKPDEFDTLNFVEKQTIDIISHKYHEQLDEDDSISNNSNNIEDNNRIQLTCELEDLYKIVFPGQQLQLDDGRLLCKVKAIEMNKVTLECLNSYEMTGQISMTMPGIKTDAPLISEHEMAALLDLIQAFKGIEIISLPRVRQPADVIAIKMLLQHVDPGNKIKILSKI